MAAVRTSVLLERDAELATIAHLVEDAAAGEANVVLLEGEAGIGKTRLLAELRRGAAAQGLPVLTARGSELERSFSFGVVRQLLEGAVLEAGDEAFAGAAAAARPVFGPLVGPAEGQDVSFAALHGLYWLVANLVADRPHLLAIDDLHWADTASLRFLAYLAPRAEGLPLLLAASLRPIEQAAEAALLAELAHVPTTVTLRPGPLSLQAAGALIEERLGQPSDHAFSEAAHRATGGNPLLLQEVLRALQAERVEPRAAQAGMVAELGPRAVSRAVILRLSRLDAAAIAAARALAILGDAAELPHLARLAGISETDAGRALAALARAEIARPDRPLGFAHPLLGEAVYRDIPLGERDQAHAEAARLLAEAGEPDEHVAAHLLRLPGRGDAWVVDALTGAARAAMAHAAADSACEYLARALAEPPAEERRAELLLQLGIAESHRTGPSAAIHLRSAYDLAEDALLRAQVASVLGPILTFTDRPEEAVALAREAAAACAEPDLRRQLDAISLFGAFWDPALRDDRAFEALRQGDGAPGDLGANMLDAVAAYDWLLRGGPADRCVRLARRALGSGELLARANGSVPAVGALLVLLLADCEDAVDVARGSMEGAHRSGSLFQSCAAYSFLGFTLLVRGELDEASRLLAVALEQLDAWGFLTVRVYPRAFTAELELDRGNLAAARAVLDDTPFSPETPSNTQTSYWYAARLRLLVEAGEHERALALADECLERFAGGFDDVAFHPWRSLRALALHGLGRGAEAERSAEEELERARLWGAPRGLGRALRTLAIVRRADALVLLEEAVALLEGSTARLELARALAHQGTALRHARRPGEAREPLRRALELAEVCGADGLREQARSELYATGARPRSAAARGPEALTPSERRVAELAVAGQSNRDIAQGLFVTPKTVEVHLSSAYRKLGIRSRRELDRVLS